MQSSTRRAPNWFPLLIASLKSLVIAQFQFWPLISFSKPYWYRVYRGGSRDSEKEGGGGDLCRPPLLTDEENLRFQMVWQGLSNVRNYKFLVKYLFQYIQNFSIFIYNESLPMKSYQFFKIYKRFYKKKKKKRIQQSIRKEKLRKVGICYFIKPFKMTVNQFFFNRSFCSQIFFFYFASSFTAQFSLFDIRMN